MDKMELLYPQSELTDFMLMFVMHKYSFVLLFFMILFLQNNPMVTFY